MAKYRFDDIAFNSTAKKKPVEEDKYTYIGLEHLDSGNLQVTRFGSEIAPKGEKLIMKKGDVLFGKRRAYQKKVAIAPFDGIFSAHGMVLRPKENVINKDYFPFFISSDYFLDAAIKISVGSLSPTINWGDLKELEFELPDMVEQERLAKILWAAEDLKQKYDKVIIYSKITYYAKISSIIKMSSNRIRIGECFDINRLLLSNKTDPTYEFPYIDISSVTPRKLGAISNYLFANAPGRARRVVNAGDILISGVRPNLKSFVRVFKSGYIASTGFIVLTPKDELLAQLVYHIIFSEDFQRFCNSLIAGTNYPAITASDVANYQIPLLESNKLKKQVEILNCFETIINNIEILKDKCINIQKNIINNFSI